MYNNSASEDEASQCTAVSSYYGPGSLCSWYLIILSVIVTWRYSSKTGFRARRLAITNDFIAAMLYPLLSTCHLIYLLFRCPLTQDVLESIWLPSLSQDTDSTNTEDEVQSTIHNGLKNIISALRVFELFTILVICGSVSTLHHELDAGPTSPTTFTLLIALSWLTCVWSILVYKSCQHDALLYVPLRLFILGAYSMTLCSLPGILFSIISPLLWLFRQAINVYKHSYRWLIEAYQTPSSLLRKYFRWIIQFLYDKGYMLIMLPLAWIGVIWPLLPLRSVFETPVWEPSESLIIVFVSDLFFPSTGIGVLELDQVAGMIGGTLTLLVSVYDVMKDMNIVGNTFERWSLSWKLRLILWVQGRILP